MTTQDEQLAAILSDPLARARQKGRPIVGYVGFDIAEDVLAAIDGQAVHLPWSTDGPTPFADQWLESSFPPLARSILQAWHAGEFDDIETVIFSRGDDVSQRLWYYVHELQRRRALEGPKPLIFDVARALREASLAYTAGAVRRLSDALGLDDSALRAGVQSANRRRALLRNLEARRDVRGTVCAAIARAALFDPIEEWMDVEACASVQDGRRVVIAGSAPPGVRLHETVEAAGWNVVAEETDLALSRLGEVVDPNAENVCAAIGEAAHRNRIGARSFASQADRVLAAVDRTQAEAVIIWVIEEDEARAWDVSDLSDRLEGAGVRALRLTRRRYAFDDGAKDEIAAFLGEGA